MESAFLRASGPWAAIKVPRNAEDSACGLSGECGPHTGPYSPQSPHPDHSALGSWAVDECLVSDWLGVKANKVEWLISPSVGPGPQELEPRSRPSSLTGPTARGLWASSRSFPGILGLPLGVPCVDQTGVYREQGRFRAEVQIPMSFHYPRDVYAGEEGQEAWRGLADHSDSVENQDRKGAWPMTAGMRRAPGPTCSLFTIIVLCPQLQAHGLLRVGPQLFLCWMKFPAHARVGKSERQFSSVYPFWNCLLKRPVSKCPVSTSCSKVSPLRWFFWDTALWSLHYPFYNFSAFFSLFQEWKLPSVKLMIHHGQLRFAESGLLLRISQVLACIW